MYRIIGTDGKEYGPVPAEQLRQWIAEGRAHAGTQAIAEGSREWKPLGSFPEFSIGFAAAAPPRPAAPPAVLTSLAPMRKTHGLAVSGLVLGIVSLTVGFCCCYGIPINIIGIVFSLIALSQINQNPQLYDGKGAAIAGLILSAISLVLGIVLFAIFGTLSILSGPGGHSYRL